MKEKKSEDLRVIKTKRNIRFVFEELLTNKPVENITVTELASLALINKGTFYHHYNDIYELYTETVQRYIEDFCEEIDFYEDFFIDPEQFVSKYLKHSEKNSISKKFPYLKPEIMRVPVPVKMTLELKKHIFATNHLEKNIENEMRVECAVSNIFTSLFRYGNTYTEELIKVLGENINALFPDKK